MRDFRSSQPAAVRMTSAEMCAVIMSARAGDRFKLIFADKTFDGDLAGRILFIVAMCPPMGNAIDMPEMARMTLRSVAESGKWCGFRTYTITILPEFDPEYFIQRTLGRDLLESITKL